MRGFERDEINSVDVFVDESQWLKQVQSAELQLKLVLLRRQTQAHFVVERSASVARRWRKWRHVWREDVICRKQHDQMFVHVNKMRTGIPWHSLFRQYTVCASVFSDQIHLALALAPSIDVASVTCACGQCESSNVTSDHCSSCESLQRHVSSLTTTDDVSRKPRGVFATSLTRTASKHDRVTNTFWVVVPETDAKVWSESMTSHCPSEASVIAKSTKNRQRDTGYLNNFSKFNFIVFISRWLRLNEPVTMLGPCEFPRVSKLSGSKLLLPSFLVTRASEDLDSVLGGDPPAIAVRVARASSDPLSAKRRTK